MRLNTLSVILLSNLILLNTVLINHFIFTKPLGLSVFRGGSNKLVPSLSLAFATTFILTLCSILSFLADNYILKPLDIGYLRILTVIFVIMFSIQFTKVFIKKFSALLHRPLITSMPLMTLNCIVLGVALLSIKKELNSAVTSALYGFGVGIGFSITLILFSAIHERVAVADVPQPLQGAAISMMTAGIMSLAYMGFTSMLSL